MRDGARLRLAQLERIATRAANARIAAHGSHLRTDVQAQRAYSSRYGSGRRGRLVPRVGVGDRLSGGGKGRKIGGSEGGGGGGG